MSFRVEHKYKITSLQLTDLFNYFKDQPAPPLYNSRYVNSIYFDNHNLQSYLDGEEGITPRKKIRIRFYGSEFEPKEMLLETKISALEGRYKISKKILNYNKFLYSKITDAYYGLIFPVLRVRYKRNYFQFGNSRITIDSELRFQNFKNKSYASNNSIQMLRILEFKTKAFNDLEKFENLFPFIRCRYSKYNEGIRFLKLH